MSSVQIQCNYRIAGLRTFRRDQCSDESGAPVAEPAKIDVLLEQQERDARSAEACVKLVADLQAALGQIRDTMEQRIEEMSDYVLELAFGLAERVMDREIESGRYDLRPTLMEVLAQGLHGLGEGAIRIFVHPIDHERLEHGFGGHPSASLGREVEMEVDPSVDVGSFRLETRLGQVLHSPKLLLERMTKKISEEMS